MNRTKAEVRRSEKRSETLWAIFASIIIFGTLIGLFAYSWVASEKMMAAYGKSPEAVAGALRTARHGDLVVVTVVTGEELYLADHQEEGDLIFLRPVGQTAISIGSSELEACRIESLASHARLVRQGTAEYRKLVHEQ